MKTADRAAIPWKRIAAAIPGLLWLRAYRRPWLRDDLVAGVSVAAILVPSALAYGQQAGLPAVAGLYAAMLAMVGYAFFGSSRQLMPGPDATSAALVAAAVAPLAGGDPARYAALAGALAVFTAAIYIIGGLVRLGFIADFLSQPILVGYINGVAITVIVGQLGKICGISISSGYVFGQLAQLIQKLGQTNGTSLALGLSTIGLVLVLNRISRRLPAALVAVGIMTALVVALDLRDKGVAVVGEVPRGLPAPQLPLVPLGELGGLLVGAVGICLVVYPDAILTARSFATKGGYTVDANQEFLGLGAASLAAALFQGFPIAGSSSRTAVADQAGGKTQATGLFAAAFVAVVLLVLTAPLAYLPNATLGGVVVVAALGLIDLRGFRILYRLKKDEFALGVATLAGVLLFGILPGILVAVGLSILRVVYRVSRPHDAVLGLPETGHGSFDIARNEAVETVPGLLIYRFDAPLFFANAEYFSARVQQLLREATEPVKWLLIDAEGLDTLDITAAAMLEQLVDDLDKRGIVMAFARTKGPFREMLRRAGLTDKIGDARFFPTVKTGVWAYLGRTTDGQPLAGGEQPAPADEKDAEVSGCG